MKTWLYTLIQNSTPDLFILKLSTENDQKNIFFSPMSEINLRKSINKSTRILLKLKDKKDKAFGGFNFFSSVSSECKCFELFGCVFVCGVQMCLKAFSHCAAFVLGSVRVFEPESVL